MRVQEALAVGASLPRTGTDPHPQLWEDNYRVDGARKLCIAARRAGHDIGRDQVSRLMRIQGIEGVRRRKRVRTTKPDLGAPRHPDLIW